MARSGQNKLKAKDKLKDVPTGKQNEAAPNKRTPKRFEHDKSSKMKSRRKVKKNKRIGIHRSVSERRIKKRSSLKRSKRFAAAARSAGFLQMSLPDACGKDTLQTVLSKYDIRRALRTRVSKSNLIDGDVCGLDSNVDTSNGMTSLLNSQPLSRDVRCMLQCYMQSFCRMTLVRSLQTMLYHGRHRLDSSTVNAALATGRALSCCRLLRPEVVSLEKGGEEQNE